eukprot:GFUD01122792.1.p1 GENE.GFUD01122792.1~~GFUD01122792.1.p1  ORF type:complete len:246 (-),score=50.77 GFUD01122792.1:55-792(-)
MMFFSSGSASPRAAAAISCELAFFPMTCIPYRTPVAAMAPDPTRVVRPMQRKIGGIASTMYRAVFCQGGLLSTISAKEATKSRNMQQKGASMTIIRKPAEICQMPATMHRGKMVMQHQTPNSIATTPAVIPAAFPRYFIHHGTPSAELSSPPPAPGNIIPFTLSILAEYYSVLSGVRCPSHRLEISTSWCAGLCDGLCGWTMFSVSAGGNLETLLFTSTPTSSSAVLSSADPVNILVSVPGRSCS